MKSVTTAKLHFIISMLIFGTIGIFVKYIPLSSSVIACARGFIGMIFLCIVILIKKGKISFKEIKSNLWQLLLSGAAIGVNWFFLFEAYNYTTVATATLCYYFAPVFVIIASPFLLKEKLSARKVLCAVTAFVGIVCVSGAADGGIPSLSEMTGIAFGLGAALLYAFVMVLNKKISNISAYDKTMVQLGVAAIIILPYVLLTEEAAIISLEPLTLILLLTVGVVHTGFTYALYFGSFENIKAQTAAILSYIDPVTAIILSWVILREEITLLGIAGAVLVIGSALASEIRE